MVIKTVKAEHPLKKHLVIELLEEFHATYQAQSAPDVADHLARIFSGQVNQCYYCGRIGLDVNEYAHYHVGGYGEVPAFCCDDARACIQRVEQNKED